MKVKRLSLRFNLDREDDRRAWEALHRMDARSINQEIIARINAILAAYYEEKRSVKPANVAQCACIHKMLGYIFSVLRNQKPFELRSPEEHLALMRSKTADIAA